MSESHATKPIRVAPDFDPPSFFQANIPTRSVPIRFEYEAIRDLHADIAFAQESWGLLLGSLSPQALSIRCGEVLQLGQATKANPKTLHSALREFIQARRQNPLEGAEQLAGFFRTQADGWAEMRESDREIATRHFRGSASLFLIIRTPAHRPWSAALFDLDPEGTPTSHTPALEFPFDEYLLRNGYSTDLVTASPPLDVLVPPTQPAKPRWVAAAVLFVSLLAISGAVFKWYSPAGGAKTPEAATATATTLNLKVNRSGTDFEISWDRLSPLVQQAPSASLTISDGALTRAVALSAQQLRDGRILYSPLFEELTFRLEVATRDRGPLAESVQVLAWSGKQTSDVLTVAPPDPSTNSPARIVANGGTNPRLPATRLPVLAPVNPQAIIGVPATKSVPPATASAPPATSAAPPQNQPQPAKASPISETARVNPPSSPPPARSQDVAPVAPARVETLPPAAASQRPPVNTPLPQPVVDSPKPAASPAVQNSPAVTTQTPAPPPPVTPAVTAAAPTPVATPIAPAAAGPGIVVFPVPTDRVAPKLPRNIPTGTTAGAPRAVSVRVMVDSSGRVQTAEIVSSTPKGAFGEATMKSSALEAAKLWKFRPGQLNGKNVAAEYTIDFQFR